MRYFATAAVVAACIVQFVSSYPAKHDVHTVKGDPGSDGRDASKLKGKDTMQNAERSDVSKKAYGASKKNERMDDTLKEPGKEIAEALADTSDDGREYVVNTKESVEMDRAEASEEARDNVDEASAKIAGELADELSMYGFVNQASENDISEESEGDLPEDELYEEKGLDVRKGKHTVESVALAGRSKKVYGASKKSDVTLNEAGDEIPKTFADTSSDEHGYVVNTDVEIAEASQGARDNVDEASNEITGELLDSFVNQVSENDLSEESEDEIFEESEDELLDESVENELFDESEENELFDESEDELFDESVENELFDESEENELFDESEDDIFWESKDELFKESEDDLIDESNADRLAEAIILYSLSEASNSDLAEIESVAAVHDQEDMEDGIQAGRKVDKDLNAAIINTANHLLQQSIGRAGGGDRAVANIEHASTEGSKKDSSAEGNATKTVQVTVLGCKEYTKPLKDFLKIFGSEYARHLDSITVTCGACTTLSLRGELTSDFKMCSKGTYIHIYTQCA